MISLLNFYNLKENAMRSKHLLSHSAIGIILIFMIVLLTNTAFCGDPAYPKKPIKLMVPYGAGGSTDLTARILASVMPDCMGQPAVVVNKPGGSGSICLDFVSKAKPDGYTMLVISMANVLYSAMNPKLPYKYDDFVYLGRLQITPNVLIVNAKSPWKTFLEMTADMKKNPGKFKFGTAGLGTGSHIGGVLINEQLGFPAGALTAVHYDSDTAAVLSVVQGETQFYQGNIGPAKSSIDGGLARVLYVTTKERVALWPGVPTSRELGFPKSDFVPFRAVLGPPGLPNYVKKAWEDAIKKIVKYKPWLKLVKNLGDTPAYLNAADMTKLADKTFKDNRLVFKELGLLVK